MKRLAFLLIAITALIWVCQPQVSAQDLYLKSGQLYGSYTGLAADTAKGTTAANFDVFVGKGFMYYYDYQVKADSSGDASNFSVQLSGSNDNSNWYTIGSAITWYMTSSDTLLRLTNMTSVSTSTSIAATADYHALQLAAGNEYHDFDYPLKYEYHAIDSTGGGGYTQVDTVSIAAAVVTDTVTLATRTITDTVTVGARTITETLTEASVSWRYLRVTFTGAGANSRMELNTITVAIRPKLFSF